MGHVKIDDDDRGLMSVVECVNKNYVKTRYETEDFNLYKVEPQDRNGEIIKGSDLRYYGDDISLYPDIFGDAKTDDTDEEDNKRCVQILKNINSTSSSDVIEANFVDFDRIIKIVAVNKVTANVDNFASKTLRNFYIYEVDGKIDIIPYDFDISWTSRANVEFWKENINDYNLETCNENIYSRIIEIIIENEEYYERYYTYVEEAKQILRDMDTDTFIDNINLETKEIFKSGQHKLCSERQYNYSIDRLKDFARQRQEFKNYI